MQRKIVLCLLAVSAQFLTASVKVTYGYSTHQNKKPYQEDRFTYANVNGGQFFGVYDGHGGNKVSSFLKYNLHAYFQECLGKSRKQRFEYAFARAEEYVLTNYDDGSTALVAYIDRESVLHYAWVGDSRAVLENNGTVQFATQDHKPDRVHEKERIERAGGKVWWHGVWRVNGLAVSRSIGDRKLKNAGQGQIIADPDWEQIYLKKSNHFMIMASDGLWDVITNEEAVAMVTRALQNKKPLNKIAQELQDAAIKKGSTDNITVCVIKFDW